MGAYEVSRTITVAADPARVRSLVEDFHAWRQWSPWEDLDPQIERSYAGPPAGPGASYSWSGNRKAGRGEMRIVSASDEAVAVDVRFEKPFKSESRSTFELVPAGAGTAVTWRMTGEQHGVMGLVGRVVPMDRLVGKDFERGLARLKSAAETPG